MKTDSQIQREIVDELEWAPYLNSSKIGVASEMGIGLAPGVTSIVNKLEIESYAFNI